MTIKIDFYSVHADEIEAGVFTVNAKSLGGVWFQHQGPNGADYFTEAQASTLVRAVRFAGQINEQNWVNGTGGYYGTDAHEYALLETEFYAA